MTQRRGSADEGDLARRIGTAIASQRKKAGLTQAYVADLVGLEKETVSRIETGSITPTIHRLGQFAELYGCPLSALFGEYRGAAGDDATAIHSLISDLSRESRQTAIRIVSEFVVIARERDQMQRAITERRELEKTLPPSELRAGRKRPPL
ncbi:transcriptional regulator with XRE-family HTH domain [Robbsia andropogonis]|uniref:helix-turn-helix domain-containing protein n=1 Tax=Robbsia andropogonis TaxID=28092 RepID=UPI003D1CCDBA